MDWLIGKTVRDKITGFEGVVTGYTQYISGYNQALVQPPAKKDGDYVEAIWLDEQRLEILDVEIHRLDY